MDIKTKIILALAIALIGLVTFGMYKDADYKAQLLAKDNAALKLSNQLLDATTAVAVESAKEVSLNTKASLEITKKLHNDKDTAYSNLTTSNADLDARVSTAMQSKESEIAAASVLIDELNEYAQKAIKEVSL